MHAVSPLNSKKGVAVAQSSSRIKGKFVKWMVPVLVNGKVLGLVIRPLGRTGEAKAQNFAGIREKSGVYACRW